MFRRRSNPGSWMFIWIFFPGSSLKLLQDINFMHANHPDHVPNLSDTFTMLESVIATERPLVSQIYLNFRQLY
jgi:hypothetical protein